MYANGDFFNEQVTDFELTGKLNAESSIGARKVILRACKCLMRGMMRPTWWFCVSRWTPYVLWKLECLFFGITLLWLKL